jgi:phosphinothricin acetyltransferase
MSVESRREWFESHSSPRHPIFVDETAAGQIRGWCSVSPYRPGRDALANTAELSYYVHSIARRQGVATALLDRVIVHCRCNGFKNLFAILLDGNTASISLLVKFKFELWGRLPKVAEIEGKEIDHLYFGRRITPVS